MGKDKGNRTKNNARPSNSARSAELLQTQGPTIFGFTASKDGTVPIFSGVTTIVDEMDSSVDTQFQLVLKKMTKKDGTTKHKALQEFAELCKNDEVEKVKSILRFWPRLYCQLCCDPEHRVREAAHVAHRIVVAKVKRDLAPFLKEIIGPWFTSQYDTFPPAASAAVASLEEAFSPTKMAEAITFCQTEILEYLHHNLTVHTPQTLSNPKTTTPEEMEARYRRVMSSSLFGYAFYFHKIKPEVLNESLLINKKILSSPKFWKLGLHKDPLIKRSFLIALMAVFQHGPHLVSGEVSRVCSVLLNSLGDDDPLVLPVVWECLLHACVSLPECWSQAGMEKQLLPKLFQVLRNGGLGHASTIFPTILPLLTKMPNQIIGDKERFFSKLFESMISGLENGTVNRSQSESRVVTTTFVECIKFVLMTNLQETSLTENIMKEQIMRSVQGALLPSDNVKMTRSFLFYGLADLVRWFYRNSPSYQTIIDLFWRGLNEEVATTCVNSICNDDLEVLIDHHLEMLSILRDPTKFVPQRHRERVKFASDLSDKKEELISHNKTPTVPEFDKSLQNCASAVVSAYFTNFKANNLDAYLKGIIRLLNIFDAWTLPKDISGSDDVSELFTTLKSKEVGEKMVLNFGLAMLPYIKETEQDDVLQILMKLSGTCGIELIEGIFKCHPAVLRNWAQCDIFSKMYLQLVELFLNGEMDINAHETLSRYLTTDNLLTLETSLDCVKKLTESLKSNVECEGKRVGLLASALSPTLCRSLEFEELTITSFKNECINGSCCELVKICVKKLKYFRAHEENYWITFSSRLSDNIDITVADLEGVIKIIASFIDTAIGVNLLSEICELSEIEEAAPLVGEFLKPIRSLAVSAKALQDLALSSYEFGRSGQSQYYLLKAKAAPKICGFANPSEDNVLLLIKWMKLVGMILKLYLTAYPVSRKYEDLKIPNRYLTEGDTEIQSDVVPRKLSAKELETLKMEANCCLPTEEEYPDDDTLLTNSHYLRSFICETAVLNLLCINSEETKYYHLIHPGLIGLNKLVDDVLQSCTPTDFNNIYGEIRRLVDEDYIWCSLKPILSNFLYRRFGENHDYGEGAELKTTTLLSGDLSAGNLLYLASLLRECSDSLPLELWEECFVKVDELLLEILDSPQSICDKLEEIGAVSNVFLTIQRNLESESEKTNSELRGMWSGVVEERLWQQLFSVWKTLVPSWTPEGVDPAHYCQPVKNDLLLAPMSRLCEVAVKGLRFRSPESIDELVTNCANYAQLVLSPNLVLQLTARDVLKCSIEKLVEEDSETLRAIVASCPEEEDKALFTKRRDGDWQLKIFDSALQSAEGVVEALLSDFKLGDTCSVQPFTDAFTYANSYLTLWSVLLEMCGQAHAALRYQYAAWLKTTGRLYPLLGALFKLMPAEVIYEDCIRDIAILNNQSLGIKDAPSSKWLEKLAFGTYMKCLKLVPAGVREWWTDCDHREASLIAQVTSLHFSPILIDSELKSVQESFPQSDKNLTVTVNPAAREVVGTYVIDEASMQCTLSLPNNYPLGTAKVQFNSQQLLSRGWQISLFLGQCNGSLKDALFLWESDLNKKFQSLVECEICFSILYGTNFEVPKLSCSTCRKKFHSTCLYKWFSTSNKSSCPTCRNLF